MKYKGKCYLLNLILIFALHLSFIAFFKEAFISLFIQSCLKEINNKQPYLSGQIVCRIYNLVRLLNTKFAAIRLVPLNLDIELHTKREM